LSALDTSVAVPSLLAWHEHHGVCADAASGASIPSHALLETYSVITRLPAPHRVRGTDADRRLGSRFAAEHILVTPSALQRYLVRRLVVLAIEGGAVYDALVGLTAKHHGEPLLTRDARAARTYELLGVPYELVRS